MRQFGYLQGLYQDAGSTKHDSLCSIQRVYRLFRILQNVITFTPTSLATSSAFMLPYQFHRKK